MKFDILVFFENLSRKFKFYLNLIRIMGTLHLCTFMTLCTFEICRSHLFSPKVRLDGAFGLDRNNLTFTVDYRFEEDRRSSDIYRPILTNLRKNYT